MRIVDVPMESVCTLADVYSTKPAHAYKSGQLTKFLKSGPRTWSEVGLFMVRFMLEPSMDYGVVDFCTYVPCHGIQLLIADQADEQYREAVALNPHLSIEVQWKLATDSIMEVRESLAENRGTCREVLIYLAFDNPHHFVQDALYQNPNTPISMKSELIRMPLPGFWVGPRSKSERYVH
jgi:hypothetical protein